MEDPAKEIPGIIQAIVQNEDLKRQEETVSKYFSESAILDHMVVFCKNREEILAAYQIWVMSNHSLRATIHQVAYKEDEEYIMVRMTQYVRKWWNPFEEKGMPMMVFFKLEDAPSSTGREHRNGTAAGGTRRKRIAFQQDCHTLDPILVNIPVLNLIAYGRFGLRTLLTMTSTITIKVLQATIGTETITYTAKSAYKLLGLT
ncbi:hypothetical protein KFL_000060760 [Klebsormidium nitens]|uniref:SigF-like NTF2-like domain-containing protein n=1 Tax=Klebsormidium nitens TaxID=105231 RepID=A0A0U9HIB2_KLENI|nr:hypothetical protein KFL_000060760 [Klebsormidium nitens]|eukprot:GAQ78009.1 hypothetical protein KFL_000060760 [Klebsormidium nitens]